MKTITLPNLIILAAGVVFTATLIAGILSESISTSLGGLGISALFGGIAYGKKTNNG